MIYYTCDEWCIKPNTESYLFIHVWHTHIHTFSSMDMIMKKRALHFGQKSDGDCATIADGYCNTLPVVITPRSLHAIMSIMYINLRPNVQSADKRVTGVMCVSAYSGVHTRIWKRYCGQRRRRRQRHRIPFAESIFLSLLWHGWHTLIWT